MVVVDEVLVVEVDVVLVDVEVDELVVEAGLVVVVELDEVEVDDEEVELDDGLEVSDVGIVVLGELPLSSCARKKMATPPASTSTKSTITAMPSGEDQGERLGAASGPTAGVGSAA